MIERVEFRPQKADAEELRKFFAEVFVSLDARPRPLDVRIRLPDGADAVIDLADGNPVFAVPTAGTSVSEVLSPADFRRRWLAEHPVPLVLEAGRTRRLRFVPTDANRLKVHAA